ncbi:winged helix-turn-helix transcriptional regulator [Streptomyces sp. PKU-MA01144]|nr:winged helix-turn-helix transcriptional regulator [Streptomyces sp. PKU-MA01144]
MCAGPVAGLAEPSRTATPAAFAALRTRAGSETTGTFDEGPGPFTDVTRLTSGPHNVKFINVMNFNESLAGEGPEGPPEALTKWTGFLLNWVAAHAREAYERVVAQVGLKPQHLGVLTHIQHGPMIQARLSDRLRVFKPVMVTLVNELEAMGLAERRPHAGDRRAVEVHILAAGLDKIREVDSLSEQASAEFFSPLTPQEQQTLHGLLTKLAEEGPAGPWQNPS